jgi:serine/threonine protein kinase
MIDRLRRPVVMDFGIAKVAGKSAGLTQQGTVLGTPAYMAPEQAGQGTEPVTARSDVYSLGAVLYTLLTGQPPFHEGTVLRTLVKVASAELPPPPRSLRKATPAELERICMKCLSKAPAGRYPSAQALADDLRRFRAGSAAKPSSASLRSSLPSVVLRCRDTGQSVRLFGAANLLGRASECDIIVPAANVSKSHCQILLQRDIVVVEDLGSANGTSVNGRAVTRARLHDGDELDVGGHIFEVLMRRPGAPPATP